MIERSGYDLTSVSRAVVTGKKDKMAGDYFLREVRFIVELHTIRVYAFVEPADEKCPERDTGWHFKEFTEDWTCFDVFQAMFAYFAVMTSMKSRITA